MVIHARSPHCVTALRGARLRLAALGATALVASAGLAACKPPPPAPPKRPVQACDTSTCLIAWEVVDSDNDGVADADELVTGTDPFDPTNRPAIEVIIRTVLDRKLPSFEYGQSFLVVVPMEAQLMREAERDPLTNPAIPATSERKTVLDGLGFDLEALTGHGINTGLDGFTLGLDRKKEGEELPGPMIGGIPAEQISADGSTTGRIDDCCIPPILGHGEVVQHIDYGDWQATTFADGALTVCGADAGCKTYPPSTDEYTNPDADSGAAGPVTDEQLERWKRTYGAAERRVENWNLPEFDPEKIKDPFATVSFINPDADPAMGGGLTMIFDAPRLTTAQPEGRPDLPNPREGAPGGPPCNPGCE